MRERELLDRAAAGDEDAFRLLYEAHRTAVFQFAWWVTASVSLAEDVVQDCFLALLERPQAFDPERSSLRTYLLAVARNQSYKRIRRLPDDAERADTADENVDLLASVLEAELADVVQRAIELLPPLQREAIVLAHYQDLSGADMAGVMGVDVETAKGRLKRGRERLRSLLAGYCRDRERCTR